MRRVAHAGGRRLAVLISLHASVQTFDATDPVTM
jgi:hypothetical protein